MWLESMIIDSNDQMLWVTETNVTKSRVYTLLTKIRA